MVCLTFQKYPLEPSAESFSSAWPTGTSFHLAYSHAHWNGHTLAKRLAIKACMWATPRAQGVSTKDFHTGIRRGPSFSQPEQDAHLPDSSFVLSAMPLQKHCSQPEKAPHLTPSISFFSLDRGHSYGSYVPNPDRENQIHSSGFVHVPLPTGTGRPCHSAGSHTVGASSVCWMNKWISSMSLFFFILLDSTFQTD